MDGDKRRELGVQTRVLAHLVMKRLALAWLVGSGACFLVLWVGTAAGAFTWGFSAGWTGPCSGSFSTVLAMGCSGNDSANPCMTLTLTSSSTCAAEAQWQAPMSAYGRC